MPEDSTTYIQLNTSSILKNTGVLMRNAGLLIQNNAAITQLANLNLQLVTLQKSFVTEMQRFTVSMNNAVKTMIDVIAEIALIDRRPGKRPANTIIQAREASKQKLSAASFEGMDRAEEIVSNIATPETPTLKMPSTAIEASAEAPSPMETATNLFSSIGQSLKSSLSGFRDMLKSRISGGWGAGVAKAESMGMGNLGGLAMGTLGAAGQGLAGVSKGLGNMASGGVKAAASLAKLPFQQIGAMAPQMMALTLVMEPALAFLEAFLEPLSFVSDYFEAFGGILSQLLLPVVTALSPMFASMIPVLQTIVIAISPITTSFAQLIATLTPFLVNFQLIIGLFNGFIPVLNTLAPILTAFTPIFTSLSSLITTLVNALSPLLNVVLTPLCNLLERTIPYIETFVGWVTTFIETISGLFTGGKKK